MHAVDEQERATKSLQNELKILVNQSSTYACNVCSQTFTSETMFFYALSSLLLSFIVDTLTELFISQG